MTRQLVDEIQPRQRYLRSANVEYHATFGVNDYIPTGRALEVLHRIARGLSSESAGRAWSLTGPYGSGKSSYALFLHALLGPEDARYQAAMAALEVVDSDLARELTSRRLELNATRSGFLRAVATAQAEPAARTVLRALNTAIAERWRKSPPAAVSATQMRALGDPSARNLGQLLEALAEHAPVVIVLDEFGKNLEHFASQPEAGDLFVLQELAERCSSGRSKNPTLLVTLQHLAFDDYVRGTSAKQRREWGKVQGRFEDIPFLDSADQTLRLIPAALDDANAGPTFLRRRASWAAEHQKTCADLGLQRLLPDADDLIERCYPLHPLVLLALPELCSRFGQHGRTLFAFLTGQEPNSVGDFLRRPLPRTGPLPTVSLDRLYDFFAGPGLSALSSHASRWLEIDTVLREATGLAPRDQQVVKIVGLLNLLTQSGPLRAHPGVIRYAVQAAGGDNLDGSIEEVLGGLSERGLVTYRGFADEYRLWQGSDLDLARIVGEEREALTGLPVATLLAGRHRTAPAIAARHTQQVGMIRYFDSTFADSRQLKLRPAEDGADGLLVHWLDDAAMAARVQIHERDQDRRLPVLVATTSAHAVVREAVLELAAVDQALERPDVLSDRVARRELQEQAAQARRRLDDLLARHLGSGASGSTYHRLAVSRGGETVLTGLPPSKSLSSLLSDVCDEAYQQSPHVRNEMLGRRQLTSQAARARRDLLEAMVTHPNTRRHGLEGYGPEVAMYEALLADTGLHRPIDEADPDGPWHFSTPRPASKFGFAWGKLLTLLGQASRESIPLDRAYAELQLPPIGLKTGSIPLLLTALLVQHADSVAIYQDGSYQPRLSADLLERLLKSPDRFAIKTFAADGARAAVLGRLRNLTMQTDSSVTNVGKRRRNGTVLEVAAPLIGATASLPTYTRKTSTLAASTLRVRDALLSARQPDELLFSDLPRACDIEPFEPGGTERDHDAAVFQQRLQAALTDMSGGYSALLTQCAEEIAADFGQELTGLEQLSTLRSRLRNAAGPLADVTLLDRRLRAFVLAVLDSRDDDRAWLEALLSLVAGMPATSWQDQDLARFRSALPALGDQLRRLVALHTSAAATGRDGFDAHRITLTRPNGHEHASVVWLDHRVQPQLDAVLESALASARTLLGARGDEALLALLAGRVLSDRDDTINGVASASMKTTKGQAHG